MTCARDDVHMCIAQLFGRPGVPTDQARIESFFGHIRTDWPHLEDIADPDVRDSRIGPTRYTQVAVPFRPKKPPSAADTSIAEAK